MKEWLLGYEYKTKCKIIIQQGLLSNIAEFIKENIRSDAYFLITVPPVNKLYFEKIKESFHREGLNLHLKIIKDGEGSKSQKGVEEIIKFLSKNYAHRDSVIIAMGGGVIGDLAGFCASIYMRGIPYIQVPTSLIAQIDSSIGGKTAINTSYCKNLIGTFYHPLFVLIDPDVLKTLPDKEFINGMGEIIKYGILDEEIFAYIEANVNAIREREPKILSTLIEKCCAYKIRIVENDLYDKNERALLNLGHSIGHCLESLTGYKYFKHGEAIVWGILAVSYISHKRNTLSKDSLNRIIDICRVFKILKRIPKFSFNRLMKTLRLDKKQRAEGLIFLLPEEIGRVKLCNDIKEEEVKSAMQFIKGIEILSSSAKFCG